MYWLALRELRGNHEFRTFKTPTLASLNGLSTSDLFDGGLRALLIIMSNFGDG